MGVGGATWDTAGTLELGAGNTFTVADATEDPPFPGFVDAAWWTLTPASSSVIVLGHSDPSFVVLYSGADYDHRVEVPLDDFEGDAPVYTVLQGVTYHLLAGHDAFDSPTTYQITWSTRTVLIAGPWISTLRDREDNQLIIGSGDLLADNPDGFTTNPGWWGEVLSSLSADYGIKARHAEWGALQTLGGPAVADSGNCCWLHAAHGDGVSSEGGWDGTCSDLQADGSASNQVADPDFQGWGFETPEDPGGEISERVVAAVTLRARGLWFLPVRERLDERGVFPFPDPVADGYPEDAEIEWEDDHVELVRVELTGDTVGRPVRDSVPEGAQFYLRRTRIPLFVGGDPAVTEVWTPWPRGFADLWDNTKGSDFQFVYRDGAEEWHEVDGYPNGVDGWEGLGDRFEDDEPDETVTVGTEESFGLTPPSLVSASYFNHYDVAIRFTVRSPRYRWVYEAPGFVPPRRIFGRSDGATHGAARVFGGGNTVQAGNRTLGGIL